MTSFSWQGSKWISRSVCFVLLCFPCLSAASQDTPAVPFSVLTPARIVPPVIYRPVVQWQPWVYRGSEIEKREFRTPLRSLLFGKYRVRHLYAPAIAPQPSTDGAAARD